MQYIHLIKEFDVTETIHLAKDMHVNSLFKGEYRNILEIQLQNNAVLPRHKTDVPITVFCVSGAGTFRAGGELEDSQTLRGGTFITLEAGVEHELTAEPAVHIVITKFQPS